jgi:branched-chain amino acid aminotransferase
VWKTKEGKQQLITAPLEDNLILEGVTRASVLQIAQERLSAENASKYGAESLEVIERKFTMQEIMDAYTDGRLVEAFAAGTAFFVAPVGLIGWKEHELEIPLAEGKTGVYAKLVRGWLSDIMYGKEQHEWGVLVDEA